jgi:hypothetical protein
VIVAIDDAPKQALDGLRRGWLSGACALQLKQYTVQPHIDQ